MKFAVLTMSLFAVSCIDEGASSTKGETEDDRFQTLGGSGGHAGDGGPGAGGQPPDASGVSMDGAPSDQDANVIADVLIIQEADAPMVSPDICDDFCGLAEMCLPAACPALDELPRGLCNSCGRIDAAEVAAAVAGGCDSVIKLLFETVPNLEQFCSDEPPTEECQAFCARSGECTGSAPDDPMCQGFCRTLRPEQIGCVINAPNCNQAFGCFEDRPAPPSDEEVCQRYCQRQAQCVYSECAPGTWGENATENCNANCAMSPPTEDERQAIFENLCAGVVLEVRRRDPVVDARCDAAPEDACVTICDERVVPCDLSVADTCALECADYSDARHLCIARADGCEELSICFADPEGEARCERVCNRIQFCLEEACPPRVIPPELSVGCTAGCMEQPPAEEQVQMTEAATCREVREFIYRNNRELAPVCEGNPDFRPTPEECVAFCDNTLQACIGIGGRQFCLAACASITRDQYECTLSSDGDCESIATCLQ